MTPERWQQIDELFHAALVHEPTKRTAFLLGACSGDEELRLEVESLLKSHEENQNFIETPAGDLAAEMLGVQKARFEPGHQIGNYRIVRELGSGGMGEVYLAIDNKLGRKVALKLLPEVFAADPVRLRRFKIEARAASKLNHPNILTIHEINEDDVRFLVSEFVDGQTLRERLRDGPLTTGEALEIAEQIASALAAAQTEGIIHRDIKPENIMLRRDGIAKVVDFGLAKLSEDVTTTAETTSSLLETTGDVLMGTTHYMSPEQARGLKLDGRTDIFSLGAVLYEMITGKKAFEGETPTDVIASVLTTNPRLPSNLAAAPELQRVVSKALEKDRERRYAIVDEMLVDLRRLRAPRELNRELEGSRSTDLPGSSESPVPARNTSAEKALTTENRTISQRKLNNLVIGPIRRHKIRAALVATTLAVVVIGAGSLSSNHAPALTDKDFILIADFVNTTGDPVFDGTLKRALSVQLAQSPYLNIFPEDRIRETLAYMEKPADERLTREIARQICHRQGLKAMLVGTIASLGSNYVITLEGISQSGETIALEQIEAERKEKVLASLGTAASSLRKKLGESLNSIQSYDVPIEQATTSSMEALKAYATGDEERTKGRESLVFYKRAVEIDPNFAMAHARIGLYYFNQAQIESSKQYFQKAYELRDRVSERERFYIKEKYYNYVTGEFDKAVETLQAWSKLYPNDFVPHNNLSLNYRLEGRFEDALRETLEASRLRPNNTSVKINIIGILVELGRFDEAQQALGEMQKTNPDVFFLHATLYVLASFRGDQTVMDREIQWARGKPEEADFVVLQGAHAMYKGKVKQSEELTKRAIDLFKHQNQNENASNVLLTLAGNMAIVGKCDQAKKHANNALSTFRGELPVPAAAAVFAACADPGRAQVMLDQSRATAPTNTLLTLIVAPMVRALIEKQRGNTAEAIRLLELVRRYDLGQVTGLGNNYTRGMLYLEQRRGNEAAAEFKMIIDHRGIDTFSPHHALAYLGLARAAALNGDLGGARNAYQDFFALWKDADQDLPALIQAQKEYKRLNR